jgi:hypothetical protein
MLGIGRLAVRGGVDKEAKQEWLAEGAEIGAATKTHGVLPIKIPDCSVDWM